MATVYCVFKADIDGDGYLGWQLLFVSSTIGKAIELVRNYDHNRNSNRNSAPVHPDMNEGNCYTFVGSRDDCVRAYNMEAGDGMGYVIEAHPVL